MLEKKVLVLLIVLSFISSLDAVDFSGNLEYLFSSINRRDTILNPGNVLAIPSYSSLIEFKFNLNSGKKDMMNIDSRIQYDTATSSYTLFLDQAYLTFELNDYLKFKFGRQRIGFGVGYLWNPVNDLDVRKNIYNPTKYTEGIDGIKCVLDFTSLVSKPLSLSLEVLPPPKNNTQNIDLSYSKIGSQFYMLMNDIEFGLAGSYNKNLSAEDNVLYGLYSSIDIKGIIFGLEYSQSSKNKKIYYPQAVLNLNKRLTETSFVMLEYYYNGFGYNDNELDNLINLVRSSYTVYGPFILSNFNPGYVSKNYLFGTLSLEIVDNLSFSCSSMLNLDRYGGFIYPQISWTKIDNVTVSLEGIANIYSHNKDNEFSLNIYNYLLLIRTQFFF